MWTFSARPSSTCSPALNEPFLRHLAEADDFYAEAEPS